MRRLKTARAEDGTILVERFSPIRRVEHVAAIVTFVLLVLTGFPQKFPDTRWATWLFELFGGLDSTRTIHRVVGLVFAGHAVLHLFALLAGIALGKVRLSLLPTPQDLRDAWHNLGYYLGYRQHPPAFPKFDYRQKFEYIGIVLGGMVMIVSGLVLLFPATVASYLPGQVIPAALVAHSNEAMLALLVLVVWHVYGAHLSPEIFPLDKSIFTGYLTLEELRERHALEYRRLFPDGDPLADAGGEGKPVPTAAGAGAEHEPGATSDAPS